MTGHGRGRRRPRAAAEPFLVGPTPPAGVRWVTIIDQPRAVMAPEGVIFSTAPTLAMGSDGVDYYLKGPALEIIVAEHVGYRLAQLVTLATPGHALCRIGGSEERIGFGSRGMRVRGNVDRLLAEHRVANAGLISECIAFDTWIANEDRNVSNVVGEPVVPEASAIVEIFAIDFEKARILRGEDRFAVTATTPGRCIPGATLLPFCRDQRLYSRMCDRIAAVSRDAIERVFLELSAAIGPIPWADAASDFLASRTSRIHSLVRGELNA